MINSALTKTDASEFIISVIPILLGDGIKLFKNGRPELKLELVSSKSFDSGLIQLHYTRKS